ncbi:MAG: hypothetical protein QGI45_06035 [Myxococcota bacterium]|jgi:hypothetical protein|nr:hypothetical protein [Myxococcota bacterium]
MIGSFFIIEQAMHERFKPQAGLCQDCQFVKVAGNKKGSTFYLCRRSENESQYSRYPALPVLNCSGYMNRGQKSA